MSRRESRSDDDSAREAALVDAEGDESEENEEESDSSEGEEGYSGEESLEGAAAAEEELGCKHYRRGAKLVAPCCGGVFWCRLCHDAEKDEGEPDRLKQHKINRFGIVECVCGRCGLQQPVQQTCGGCGLVMGSYFCAVCKFWENRDRGQFHCGPCGMCRYGAFLLQ